MAFTTRKSLLSKIKGGDPASWKEFYNLYRPMAFSHGRRMGLNRSDCEELFQQVMVQFFKGVEHFQYQPGIGKFRNYLSRALHNAALRLTRERPTPETVPPELLAEYNNQIEEKILTDWRKLLFHQALIELQSQVNETTYEAFCLYGLQRRGIDEVAGYLNMAPGNIYTAKSRCVSALKEIIRELHESDPEFKI